MKKAILYKAAFILAAMMFAGCGSTSKTEETANGSRTLFTDVTFTSESSYGEDYFHTGGTNYITKGQDGLYYYIDANEYCLKVFNPETGKSTVPCDKPDCDHIYQCDAHMDSFEYALESLYAYGGHLYAIRMTQGVYSLEQMDLDGANRKNIGTLSNVKPGGKIVDYTVVFYNDSVYYNTFDENDREEDALICMSLQTGEKKSAVKCRDIEGKNVSVVKVYGDKLFFLAGKRSVVMNGQETGVQIDNIGLYEYDATDEKVFPVVRGNISGYAFDIREQKLYYSIIQEGLFCMDLQTKSEKKLVTYTDDYPYAYEVSVDEAYIYTVITNRKRGENSEDEKFAITIYDKTGTKVRSLAYRNKKSSGRICYGDEKYIFLEKDSGVLNYMYIPKKEIETAQWIEKE